MGIIRTSYEIQEHNGRAWETIARADGSNRLKDVQNAAHEMAKDPLNALFPEGCQYRVITTVREVYPAIDSRNLLGW